MIEFPKLSPLKRGTLNSFNAGIARVYDIPAEVVREQKNRSA